MENLDIKLFSSIYKGKKVFITGHTGFKGSWLSFWLKQLGAVVEGISLAERTQPSHFDLLGVDMKTFTGDIRDSSFLEACIQASQPDIVFHLAAQSLVRDSYRNPLLTYQTNVIGTLNVLEATRKTPSVRALINVTTDKVYDNKEWERPYHENDSLGGYDLYSSSKACSEILTASYRKSYFNIQKFGQDHQVLIATARAGNVIGGGDWAAERLVPDIARAASVNKPIEIRSPESIRPWEHVLEPLSGYLLLGQKLLEGKPEFASAWNFGPAESDHVPVKTVLSRFQSTWSGIQWVFKDDELKKFHEAGILKLDCSKSKSDLSWAPVWSLEETLKYTAQWYKDYYSSRNLNTKQDLERYVSNARERGLSWTQS